jgi:hypothetical protein
MAQAYADPAAGLALLAGVTANGLLKTAVAVAIGRGPFRRWAGAGLALLALASGAAMLWRDTKW